MPIKGRSMDNSVTKSEPTSCKYVQHKLISNKWLAAISMCEYWKRIPIYHRK